MEFGIEKSLVIAKDLAGVFNAGSKVLSGDFLSAFGLLSAISAFKGVDLVAFKNEIADLDSVEATAVKQAFTSNLDLENKEVQAKIVASANVLQDAVDLIHTVLMIVTRAGELLVEIKQIFSAAAPQVLKAPKASA